MIVIALIVGLVIGGLGVYAWHMSNVSVMRAELVTAQAGAGSSEAMLAQFKAAAQEAVSGSTDRLIQMTQEKIDQSNQSAAAEAAKRQVAVENLVKPVGDQLTKLQQHIGEVEKKRAEDSGTVKQMVQQLAASTSTLTTETRALNSAMKDSSVRGSWGEIQLKRIVELAGMQEHCDFEVQVHVSGEDGSGRPDMVVRLPQAQAIVVDSKAPLTAYMDASGSDDEIYVKARMKAHGEAMASHVDALSKRKYTDLINGSVDIVIMFVPGDVFLTAAYEARPGLFDDALKKGVFIATPVTLIALLKAVSYGWNQDMLSRNAEEIAALGGTLVERVKTFAETFSKVGTSLKASVDHYNRAVGSIEGRLLPTARSMQDLAKLNATPIAELNQIEAIPRAPVAEELLPGAAKLE